MQMKGITLYHIAIVHTYGMIVLYSPVEKKITKQRKRTYNTIHGFNK